MRISGIMPQSIHWGHRTGLHLCRRRPLTSLLLLLASMVLLPGTVFASGDSEASSREQTEDATISDDRQTGTGPGRTSGEPQAVADEYVLEALEDLWNPEHARAALQQALDIDAEHRLALYYSALVRYKVQSLPAEALDFARRAAGPARDFPRALILQGEISMGLDQLEDARRAYERAVELRPDSAEALSSLADVLLHAGQFQPARELIRRRVALDPTDPDGWKQLAGSYGWEDREDEALTVLDEAVRTVPESMQLRVERGSVLMKLGRWEDALADLDMALERDPNPWWSRIRAQLHAALGNYERALSDLQVSLDGDASDPNSYALQGDVLLAQGAYREALGAYEAALNLQDNHHAAVIGSAWARLNLREYEEVSPTVRAISQENPWYAPPSLLLSTVYRVQGRAALAILAGETALSAGSDVSTVHPALDAALSYASAGEVQARGEQIATLARAASGSAEWWLAWALSRYYTVETAIQVTEADARAMSPAEVARLVVAARRRPDLRTILAQVAPISAIPEPLQAVVAR